ncbi:MAG: hypothetical protein FWF54_01235 [Candidatus Azobacteroides sp.]|nr:hypothetical protein [Candidatus Azobacteroides sp.]
MNTISWIGTPGRTGDYVRVSIYSDSGDENWYLHFELLTVTLSTPVPSSILLGESVRLSASSNLSSVTKPVYTYQIQQTQPTNGPVQSGVASPYTPNAAGTYTIKAEVTAGAGIAPGTILTSSSPASLIVTPAEVSLPGVTNSSSDLYFQTNGTSRMTILNSNGNVGIGTTTPASKLEVNGDVQVGSDKPEVEGYGDKLLFLGKNYNTDPLWIARYNVNADNSELRINIGDDCGVDRFVIGTTFYQDDSWRESFSIQANGNVGIGTSAPTNKLEVNGTIRAKEVKIELNNWADHVFEPAYRLPSLKEVENHIQEHGHLPGIPTQAEVEADGIDLGSMNVKLLQKIEELTLYMIEQNRKIENLETELKQLKK